MVFPKSFAFEEWQEQAHTSPPPSRDGGWSIARGHGTVPPAIAKAPLVLPPGVVKQPSIPQGIVTKLSDAAKQLVLAVSVCPPNAEKCKLKALIDTGAQMNVIRRGLFPEETLQDARRPLLLTLADGQSFLGRQGDCCCFIFGQRIQR